jgi:hypothetical protein
MGVPSGAFTAVACENRTTVLFLKGGDDPAVDGSSRSEIPPSLVATSSSLRPAFRGARLALKGQRMTLFDLVRHAPLLGFGIRAITSHIHRQDSWPGETSDRDRDNRATKPLLPAFWYLHGR